MRKDNAVFNEIMNIAYTGAIIDAIDLFLKVFYNSYENNEYVNTIVQAKIRYNQLINDNNKGLLSSNDFFLNRNSITSSFVENFKNFKNLNIKESSLENKKIKFNYSEINSKLVDAIDIYIERGEYDAARLIISDRYCRNKDFLSNLESIPVKILEKLLIIEQKSGKLENARLYMDRVIYSNIDNKKLNLTFEIINFRLHSQQHNFQFLIENYIEILEKIKNYDNKKDNIKKMQCTILHRTAVAFAIKNNTEMSKYLFEESKTISKIYGLFHSEITADCLHAMCSLFRSVPFKGGKKSALNVLIKSQIDYLTKDYDKTIWQGNAFKSSVQCLFSEAAYYLTFGAEKGPIALCIANQLAVLAKVNDKMEGYSELIAVLNNKDIIEGVSTAMNGYSPYNLFHYNDSYTRNMLSDLLIKSSSAYKALINLPSVQSWDEVRKTINRK